MEQQRALGVIRSGDAAGGRRWGVTTHALLFFLYGVVTLLNNRNLRTCVRRFWEEKEERSVG